MSSIPVICDRCRQLGTAGAGDFSHLGDLLDFAPVPRRKERVDGWNAEKQRAFIAALAATGSKRRAAMAIGMAAYGVDQLLKAAGSDSFKAAFDRAMAIARQGGTMRIARGVADAAARSAYLAPRSGLRDHPPEDDGVDDERKMELVRTLAARFMKKVAVEREARLAGEIVAADFYLRQVTFLEVLFDLAVGGFGWDPAAILRELRRGGHGVLHIASTPFAEWLDGRRREWWRSEGEPDRPPQPDPRYLERHAGSDGDYSSYADATGVGAGTPPARGFTAEAWASLSADEQTAARQRQFDEDAEEQKAWERSALAAHEARAARPPGER